MSGRPWSRFWEALSLGPKARLTSGLLWWVPPSLLPCMRPMPNHARTHWHVARATWRDVTNVPPAVSRKRLGRFCWNFVCTWSPISYNLCSTHGWGISARAHVQRYPHTALLYLRNGLADCVQIWYVGWWSLNKCLSQVIGGVHLHVPTCAPLSHNCSASRHSVTFGPIALKFGMHLETH